MAAPPASDRIDFGNRLDAARRRANVRREDLAQYLGVHVNTVGNWINGNTDCPVAWLPSICRLLDVPASWLIDGELGTGSSGLALARQVIETLDGPLSTPDLMSVLSEARRIAAEAGS